MSNETIRVNIRVSREIKKYFEEQSRVTGISQSSLMALALGQYVNEKTKELYKNEKDN